MDDNHLNSIFNKYNILSYNPASLIQTLKNYLA